jgi:erythromycin esterase
MRPGRAERQVAAHPTLEEWIARDSVPFALDAPASLDAATDRVIAELGPEVELLALGEALHGSEEILLVRNRMFRRLVERRGYRAVAIEVSSPQARAVDE